MVLNGRSLVQGLIEAAAGRDETTTALTEALTEFRVIETPQDLALFGGTGAAVVDPLVCSDPLSSIATYDETCLPAS
ncbi:hypothetical protein AB0E01_41625 [Nocardia vinacea]|uniref:hypothetical protein n=1 Tax=Nocardia vinacea TaxID=96468 RepID=UPI0033F373AB